MAEAGHDGAVFVRLEVGNVVDTEKKGLVRRDEVTEIDCKRQSEIKRK